MQQLIRALAITLTYIVGVLFTFGVGSVVLVTLGYALGGLVGGRIGIVAALPVALIIWVTLGGKEENKNRVPLTAANNGARSEELEEFRRRADRARLLKPRPIRTQR